jgi:hypothetical protein
MTYDELDRLTGDFLADVAVRIQSPKRREWLLKIKERDAGPWHVA